MPSWSSILSNLSQLGPQFYDCHIYGLVTEIRWSTDKLFEIWHASLLGKQFVRNIDNMECTCKKWSISGIPFCHAPATMKILNINGEDFIFHWFKKSTYEETYTLIIYPINDQQVREITSYPNVMPQIKRILPRRPKKKTRLKF